MMRWSAWSHATLEITMGFTEASRGFLRLKTEALATILFHTILGD